MRARHSSWPGGDGAARGSGPRRLRVRGGRLASRRLGRPRVHAGGAALSPGRKRRPLLVLHGDTATRTPRPRSGAGNGLDARPADHRRLRAPRGATEARRRRARADSGSREGVGRADDLHAWPGGRPGAAPMPGRSVRVHGLRRVGAGPVAPHVAAPAGQAAGRLRPHQRLRRLHAHAPRPLVPPARLPGVGGLLDEHRRVHLLRRSRRRAPGGGVPRADADLPHRARSRLGLVPGRGEEALRADHQPGHHLDQQGAGPRARAAHVRARPAHLQRRRLGAGRGDASRVRNRRRASLARGWCLCPRLETGEGTSGRCEYR